MNKPVVIIIIAVLVIMLAGSGWYTWFQTQRITDIEQRLETYQVETSGALRAIAGEIQHGFSAIKESVSDVTTALAELEQNLSDEFSSVAAALSDMENRVTQAEQSISEAVFDAAALYETVTPVVLRITNGTAAVGSGFLYDDEGHVLTAYHVVENVSPIYVMMHDGFVSRAVMVGYSEESDVAVLRMENNPGISPAVMADSSLVRVGETVMAIGSPGDGDSPLGLRDTFTSGVVSQVNRFVELQGIRVSSCIQFDAPVNYGNSGCPLFNTRGEVVGLVIARISPTRGDGINWAVSSNRVTKVADSIIATGSFRFPWLGIGITDLTPLRVEQMSLASANGVLVTTIYSGSPAAAVGLRVDDIVVSLDGRAVRDTDDLVSFLIEYHNPGDSVTIEIIRNNSPVDITVVLDVRD